MQEDISDSVQSKKKALKDKKGKQSFWQKELDAAQKRVKKFHTVGDKVVKRYTGVSDDSDMFKTSRLNLFHSNTKTLMSMLYGNLPKVDVSRRYADSNDDGARVAAEIMERLLNLDVQENGKEYDTVLRSTLEDRLLPGLGCARLRYEVETEVVQQQDPTTGQMIEVEQVAHEAAPIDYYYWKDVLWGWGRNFSTLPWIAFKNELSKDAAEKRFGEDACKDLQFRQHSPYGDNDNGGGSDEDKDVIKKADIWEIWDKDSRKVFWWSKGCDKVLDIKDDPLGLKGFFPCPPFFLANPTTTNYMPTADFKLSEDLYNQIDLLETRITKITEAVKVVGVYDKSSTGVKEMMSDATENQLIPVENWAMFGEKGGLQGQIDWLPVQEIAKTLNELVQQRAQQIALLQQVSGMADVMRGGLDNQYEGVGQTNTKAKFGSARIQALQDEFAQFAGDLMQLKGEIIEKHFDPQTIVQKSNIAHSMDAEEVEQALQIIKDPKIAFRIAIRPESVAMVDFAQLQSERTDFMGALSMFLQSAGPMMEKDKATTPYLLKLLQWTMAGFKGASEIEGVMDKAIEASLEQAKQPPPPDPALAAEQAKQQSEMAKIQAKAQADIQTRNADLQADLQTIQAQSQADLMKIQAEATADSAEIEAKMIATIQTEMANAQANSEQQIAGIRAEMEKEIVKTQLELEKIIAAAEIDIEKQSANAEIDISKTARNAETTTKKEAHDDDD